MQDGLTRKITRSSSDERGREFLSRFSASLVLIKGPAAGSEFPLDRTPLVLGRGPGVELAFDDGSMSKEHVAFEAADEGFRVRDLASTNGLAVNGSKVLSADLKHGDKLSIGNHEFQFVVETRCASAAYLLSDDDAA